MRAICAVFFCVCLVMALGGRASAISINLGDSVKLYSGPGGEDGQGNSKKVRGGELYVDLSPLEDSGGHDFVTFSLDYQEFDPATLFRVDAISMVAEAPGASSTHDAPLNNKTAFLYSQFVAGKLPNYFHSAENANDLQYTIWYIEGKIKQEDDWKEYSSSHSNAKTWCELAQAATANSTSFYGVQVLNLNSINGNARKESNGKNESKVDLNVLYASPSFEPKPAAPVPEPSTLVLLAFGFAGLGLYRNRTK